MQDDKQAHEEQEEAGVQGKSPYHTPRLKRLGKVEQLTQGMARYPVSDPGQLSA